jgi:hypothetical protein
VTGSVELGRHSQQSGVTFIAIQSDKEEIVQLMQDCERESVCALKTAQTCITQTAAYEQKFFHAKGQCMFNIH